MAILGAGNMTLFGQEYLAGMQAGKNPMFTSIAIGDGYLPSTQPELEAVTSLASERVRYPIGRNYTHIGRDFAASATLTNADVAVGFKIREAAILAADPADPDNRAKDKAYSVNKVIANPSNPADDFWIDMPPNG